MNRKHFIAFGLVISMAVCTGSAIAENSIYTDGIGRIHFLGKDVNSNNAHYNYTNPEEQDLTRRLYEGTSNNVNYVDYKLKNYDHTFGADRLDTQNMWKNKFQNNVNEAQVNYREKSDTVRGSFTAGQTSIENTKLQLRNEANDSVNVIKTNTKKHWWNK